MTRPRSFRSLDLDGEITMNNGAFTMRWEENRKAVVVNGPNGAGSGYPVEIRGLNMCKDRYELVERFNRAPKVNADMASGTEATREVANTDFELLGTNAVSADTALWVEGGATIGTHGAQNDSSIVLPHLDTQQSAWAVTTWGTDQQSRFECCFQTPAAVTSCVIWAGFKKTNTPTVTTDTDQAFIILDTAASTSPTYWHTVSSATNVDTETACTSIAAVAAATNYHFVIDIDSSLIPRFYINEVLVTTGAALTTAIDLIPYFGFKDLSAGSARLIYLSKIACSRKFGA